MRVEVSDVHGNLVGRQVKGEQDGLEALLLLHLVDLVRHPQVELAQVRHSAVGSSSQFLQQREVETCKFKHYLLLVGSLLERGELDLDERLHVEGRHTSLLGIQILDHLLLGL